MRGMQRTDNDQETADRGGKNTGTGDKGKVPPAVRDGADGVIFDIYRQQECSVSASSDNGYSGAGQGKPGLRSLLESLGGEEFMVTVEFGKGAEDAGEA